MSPALTVGRTVRLSFLTPAFTAESKVRSSSSPVSTTANAVRSEPSPSDSTAASAVKPRLGS